MNIDRRNFLLSTAAAGVALATGVLPTENAIARTDKVWVGESDDTFRLPCGCEFSPSAFRLIVCKAHFEKPIEQYSFIHAYTDGIGKILEFKLSSRRQEGETVIVCDWLRYYERQDGHAHCDHKDAKPLAMSRECEPHNWLNDANWLNYAPAESGSVLFS